MMVRNKELNNKYKQRTGLNLDPDHTFIVQERCKLLFRAHSIVWRAKNTPLHDKLQIIRIRVLEKRMAKMRRGERLHN
jgi:hypothetical protein